MLKTMPFFNRIGRPSGFLRFSSVTVDAALCWAPARPGSHWAATTPAASPMLSFRKPRRELPSRFSTRAFFSFIVGPSFAFLCRTTLEFFSSAHFRGRALLLVRIWTWPLACASYASPARHTTNPQKSKRTEHSAGPSRSVPNTNRRHRKSCSPLQGRRWTISISRWTRLVRRQGEGFPEMKTIRESPAYSLSGELVQFSRLDGDHIKGAVDVPDFEDLRLLSAGSVELHNRFAFCTHLQTGARIAREGLLDLLFGFFHIGNFFLEGCYSLAQMQAAVRSHSGDMRRICLDRTAFFCSGDFLLLASGA